MLVLTRRPGQIIRIGPDAAGRTIEVRVIEIQGKDVRLGIVAPADLTILRDEVPDRRAPSGR